MVGERIDRKNLVMSGAVLFIGSMILLAFAKGVPAAGTMYVLAVVGYFFFVFNMYSYTANSYPTRIRAVGVGATDGLGHIGSTASP